MGWSKWGFINNTGDVAIKPIYDAAGNFSDGLAAVMVGRVWGFIDKSGNMAIDPKFVLVGAFGDDLAPIRVGDKWGYIDKTGATKIEPRFEMAGPFTGGVAQAMFGTQKGYIDKTGKWIWNATGVAGGTPPPPGTSLSTYRGQSPRQFHRGDDLPGLIVYNAFIGRDPSGPIFKRLRS